MLEGACSTSSGIGALSELIATTGAHVTENELAEMLNKIIVSIGFDYFQYVGRFPIDQHKCIHRDLCNLPDAWRERYASAHYADADPIARRAQVQLTPVIWSSLGDLTAVEQQIIDEARTYGIGNGVTFPVQARNGDVGMLSFATHTDGPDTVRLIKRSLPEGNLAAVFAHEAMRRIVEKTRYNLQCSLKPRELECLRWIASGKTNWEISRIIGISEHGAVYYVRRLMSKLEVHNRQLLVHRAIALGLL